MPFHVITEKGNDCSQSMPIPDLQKQTGGAMDCSDLSADARSRPRAGGGKSGHHMAARPLKKGALRCNAGATDSITENIPPSGQPEGKGEKAG